MQTLALAPGGRVVNPSYPSIRNVRQDPIPSPKAQQQDIHETGRGGTADHILCPTDATLPMCPDPFLLQLKGPMGCGQQQRGSCHCRHCINVHMYGLTRLRPQRNAYRSCSHCFWRCATVGGSSHVFSQRANPRSIMASSIPLCWRCRSMHANVSRNSRKSAAPYTFGSGTGGQNSSWRGRFPMCVIPSWQGYQSVITHVFPAKERNPLLLPDFFSSQLLSHQHLPNSGTGSRYMPRVSVRLSGPGCASAIGSKMYLPSWKGAKSARSKNDRLYTWCCNSISLLTYRYATPDGERGTPSSEPRGDGQSGCSFGLSSRKE